MEKWWAGGGKRPWECVAPEVGGYPSQSPLLSSLNISVTVSKTQGEDWQVKRGLGTTPGLKWERCLVGRDGVSSEFYEWVEGPVWVSGVMGAFRVELSTWRRELEET